VISPEDNYFGALVGWTSQNMGGRLMLRLQSVTKPAPHSADDVHSFHFMMDKKQAVQLGSYLFELAGETPPRRKKRGWIDRLLDG
jgi:hypothetical protein